jgi:hemoglobin
MQRRDDVPHLRSNWRGRHRARCSGPVLHKILDDPSLVGYFDGVDIPHLRVHQRAFISAALGGPEEYSGPSIRSIHAGLRVTDAAFDAFVGHLTATLKELGVQGASFGAVVEELTPLRDEVVTRPRRVNESSPH